MMLQQLRVRLADLERQRAEIKDQGECLIGVRLERSAPGGTASAAAKGEVKYARLRAGKGKTLNNGAKSQYVPLAKVPEVEAAIARGKQLVKVEREITRVAVKIDAITVQVSKLTAAF